MITPRFSRLLPVAALTWAAIVSPSAAQQAATPQPPLTDKTLVVWAAPANLTQRGRSALTIDDGRDHFDAIVFGELAPAKWMAGIDFWKRTLKDQAGFPAETADAKSFVQMAIVYAGKQITVYRNGRLYSKHTMAEAPLEFGPAARVNIGKRHRKQGDPAHFTGVIDDARIDAQALSAEQIAALKPNAASEFQPWAWWSFDDTEAKDRMGRFLIKSPDLKSRDYVGLFLTKDMPDVKADEDISCPNFFRIGNKDMLLCISHTLGCRYYLGQWRNEKFTPEFHARMNWHGWDFFAPESLLTADGRRVMWAWCRLEYPQSGIQSLPRELSLPDDGILRIKPLRELEKLRHDEKSEPRVTLQCESLHKLKEISGDALELQLAFQPGNAKAFGLEVYCDAEGRHGFPVTMEPAAKTLHLGAVAVPFELKPGEKADIRVFLDKNRIEVFVNDRQAAVASHKYADGNLGIQLISQGGEAVATEVKAWGMKSTYADVPKNQ